MSWYVIMRVEYAKTMSRYDVALPEIDITVSNDDISI